MLEKSYGNEEDHSTVLYRVQLVLKKYNIYF